MERKLGLLLAITLALAFALGWIIASEPGRVQTAEARAADARQGGEGARLYADNCAGCHGKYGEGTGDPKGGPPPLSSREFLSLFDDPTVRAVTAKGKPSRGMPGWSKESGGPLTGEQINEIVVFIRNWQSNPPRIPPKPTKVANEPTKMAPTATQAPPPPPTATQVPPPTATQVPPPTAIREPGPSAATKGEAAPPPVAKEQPRPSPTATQQPRPSPTATEQPRPSPTTRKEEPTTPPPAPAGVSFAKDILPSFQKGCAACHGTMGGFAANSYADVMSTGDHKPVVVPSDPDVSLLVQKLKGAPAAGMRMPPGANPASDDLIQKVVEWIKAGAKDN